MQKQNLKVSSAAIFGSFSKGKSDCSVAGLPRSGKKFWKMKNFPGQGRVRKLHFQSGRFKKKMKKVMEMSGNFKIFLKRC